MSISLDDLLAQCIEASETNPSFDLESILREHPIHADEIRTFFHNQAWMGSSDPLPSSDLSGQRLGNYELIEVIGRGGMGVVYRARQRSPSRDVALKVINAGSLADEEQRFRTEAIAAASLDHPGIVPVIEAGHQDGLDFFAMRLIDGPTLCHEIKDGPLRPHHAATIMRQVAKAVDAAHHAGIVHRDIKPDNIMIDSTGQPLVMDFGLARVTDDPSVTRSGQVLGTPHYMSPQQASGVVKVDRRTDVYSMGAVLYALLSGRPPHGENIGTAEVLRRVLQDSPTPIASVAPNVPPRLARICHSALQYNPDARYGTAAEMADDLHRFLAGEPVVASEVGVVQRVIDEIDRDSHRGHFQPWSSVLWQIGVIIFAAHAIIWWVQRFDEPLSMGYWLPRIIMLAAVGTRIGIARGGNLWPTAAAERPVWSIWLGYITTLGCINAFAALGILPSPLLLPMAALLSSFGFIAMAGQIWGGSGLIGLAMAAVAVACITMPSTAPLWFGGGWLGAMLVLSQHYRVTIEGGTAIR